MKNKLFWIVLSIILMVLAIYFFFIGISAEDKAPWFMASFTDLVVLFTSLLWRATREYTEVTKKLLEQSEQALTIDVFSEIVSSTLQVNLQLRMLESEDRKEGIKKTPERPPYVENFAIGMLTALQSTDPSLFKRISKAIENWCKTDNRFPANTFLNALEKMKQYQKAKKKERT